MSGQPKVTIIMIAYNTEQYIEEAIQSVLAQTDPSWELWIRDNGSTDSTGAICERYAAEDDRITVVHNQVNMLTDDGHQRWDREFWPEIHGKYVAHLDSDDLLHPDFVRILYQRAKETNADITIGGTILFPDGTDPYSSTDRREIPPELVIQNRAQLRNAFPKISFHFKVSWGKLWRADFWERYIAITQIPFDSAQFSMRDIYRGLEITNKITVVSSVSKPLHYWRRRTNSVYRSIGAEDDYRIKQGLFLFHHGVKCFQKSEMLSLENVKFAYDIPAGLMITLMRGIGNSGINLSERLNFLRKIVMEDEFPDPFFFDQSWTKFRPAFINALRPFEDKLDSLDFWTDWIVRLYFAMTEENMPPYLRLLSLYSAIYDKANINGFGIGELPLHEGLSPVHDDLLQTIEYTQCPPATWRRKGYCLRVMRGGYDDELERELSELQDGQDDQLDALTRRAPLAPAVIGGQIRAALKRSDQKMARKLAVCGKALYPENEAFL